ncbi:MAG: hypothetical protein DMG88_01350 [Acidobacteria bacterium]|nr:MAG: hypothetical protein DMG88_01350 [Acidobacteriota bacterium]
MPSDLTLIEDSSAYASENWWSGQRLGYNIGLVIAGPLAFVCYAAVGEWCIQRHSTVDFEITIFTIFFQAVGYLLMMGVANVLYYLGPFSEKIIKPSRIANFRKMAFRLGFWFSVLLPFIVPISLFLRCALGGTQPRY